MATWTKLIDGLDFSFKAATDGTDLYYIDNASPPQVQKYSVAGNSVSAISDGSSFGGGSITSQAPMNLCYFGGVLYVGVDGTNGSGYSTAEVWYYSGSGTTWSKALEVGDGTYNHAIEALLSDSSAIVMTYNQALGTDGGKHSGNGSSWSDSVIATLSAPDVASMSVAQGNETTPGIFTQMKDGTTAHTMQFLAGTWDTVETLGPVSGQKWFHNTQRDYVWRHDDNTPTYSWTNGFPASYTTPTNSTIAPARTYNLPYSVGYVYGGGYGSTTMGIAYLQGGEWTTPEFVDIGITLSGEPLRHMIRTSDGETYMMVGGAIGSIWQRDETFAVWITHSKGGIPGAIKENLEGA